MNVALKVIKDDTLQFLTLFGNANSFYVSARCCFLNNFMIPGCVNAHQSIELYIKAILKLDYEERKDHDLVALLRKHRSKEIYFTTLLSNTVSTEFLKELTSAYLLLRYGEAGAKSNPQKIIQILDEIAFALRSVYLKNINMSGSKIYVPNFWKADFLRDNKKFSKDTITSHPLASVGIPMPGDLPELFNLKN